jgi:hypothetical protein
MRPLIAACAVALAAWLSAPAGAGVAVYPSSQTIYPNGPLPAGGSAEVSLQAAAGEQEGALVVVTGATAVAASLDASGLAPVTARLAFAHFVDFGSREVSDALLPWDGRSRDVEEPNQPVYVQVTAPPDAPPGTYRGSLLVIVDGRETRLPLLVRVWPVRIPEPGAASTNLLTSFNVSAPGYVDRAAAAYGFRTQADRMAANDRLYAFLSRYRISPASWGFGEPRTAAGYVGDRRWWLDSAANMIRETETPFTAMRLPISHQRASARNHVAGLEPTRPDTWCPYLQAIRSFWDAHGWLARDTLPYLYAYDEPDARAAKVVAAQASVAHRCFPGARVLTTGQPSPTGANDFLWDGKGDDDVDVFAVLSRRYYGVFTTPRQAQAGHHRARRQLDAIERARARGKQIWAYTYTGAPGTPGFRAVEPLADSRLLVLWAALENIRGILYGQSITRYGPGDPLTSAPAGGEFTLLYPGATGPIPSARLEQLRDGMEDWAVLDQVRRRRGSARVRAILGGAGLFSADRRGVRLACTVGCELDGPTTYAWPRWSRDASTARRVEAAHTAALQVASHP